MSEQGEDPVTALPRREDAHDPEPFVSPPAEDVAIGGLALGSNPFVHDGIAIGVGANVMHPQAIAIGSHASSPAPRTLTVAWGSDVGGKTTQLVIHADGRVDLPEGVEPTEAARRFWEVLGDANPARLQARALERENDELRNRLQRILWTVEKGLVGRAELDSVVRLASVDPGKEVSS